jgi:hypothetical protein
MPCLICRYFQPAEPPQHKQQREAGQCQSNCGNKWDQHTAINYVKNHGKLEGWCRLHPEPKRFVHSHICGDISVLDYFYNHYWCVERIGPNDNLFEWAGKTLGTVLHGGNNWSARRNAQLAEQNVELRRQLKQARKISASRLERLQKIGNKSKPESERPAEPFRPRLIAAE